MTYNKNIILLFCFSGLLINNVELRLPIKRQIHFAKQLNDQLELSFNEEATNFAIHPPYVSAVLNDPTDPCSTEGFFINIRENGSSIPKESYSLTAMSDHPEVVTPENIIITKFDGSANIKIKPVNIGYANISFVLNRGNQHTSLELNYAVSGEKEMPEKCYWHTGISDASAAIAIDNEFMIVADDEVNALCVYHRYQSGLPVKIFNYDENLDLREKDGENYKEIDCEAGVKSIKYPGRIYWTGSMSNGGKHMNEKPNRSSLFYTNIKGTGDKTEFKCSHNYHGLRNELIKWGDKLGYSLSAAAKEGQSPKQIDGFNIEGIAFAPDKTSLYIAFRAPLVPIKNRKNTLIATIKNFESWFKNGNPTTPPDFAAPIEIDLSGRGISDLINCTNGRYIIIGGKDETHNGAVFLWSGDPLEKPTLIKELSATSKPECAIEIINEAGVLNGIQIISDNGTTIYYKDDQKAKYLQPNFKKFKDEIINIKNL